MPKRSAEEKLNHYKQKIRRLQKKVKRKRILQYSDSCDSEDNEETNHVEELADITDQISEHRTEILQYQTDEPQTVLLPPVSTTTPPQLISDPALELTDSKDTQVGATSPKEDPPEPPLDPELLSALGACSSDTPDFGENVHNSLASLWLPILHKGLSKEDNDKLMKEYLVPSNCKLLQAPNLNAEISAAVSDVVRGRDKKLLEFQQKLGVGISAINRGMDIMLKTDNKALVLKNISDGCRILSNLHYLFTKDRIKLIVPSLDKSFLHVIQDTKRDDTLFGNTLAEKIKASKAIEKQGHQIRSKVTSRNATSQLSTSRFTQQGNWTGPPRYPSNRGGGGRGGRGRAASTTFRRHYPTTTAQTTPRTSSQPKSRANTQN